MVERPDWSVLDDLIGGVRQMTTRLSDLQAQMLRMTGAGRSQDGFIKAVVGPRGQLVELEVDPRIYHQPDVTHLSAAILEAARSAVDDLAGQTRRAVEGQMPPKMWPSKVGGLNTDMLMYGHDADLLAEADRDE